MHMESSINNHGDPVWLHHSYHGYTIHTIATVQGVPHALIYLNISVF